MLTESTLNSTIGLAEKYGKAGKLLIPFDNSPLSQLVNICHYPMTNMKVIGQSSDEPVVYDITDALVGASVRKNAQGFCEHDMVMDEAVDVISQTVRTNLNIAKNEVNPKIKAVAELTQQFMDGMENVGAPRVSIQPVEWHKIWTNSAFLSMIERYENSPVRDVTLAAYIPSPESVEGFQELMKTGVARLDADIAEFIDSVSEDFLKYAYSSVFGDKRNGANVKTNSTTALFSPYAPDPDRPKVALVTFFLTKGLMEHIPEGVNMTLSEYRVFISGVMEQAGRALVRYINDRERNTANNKLIVSYPDVERDYVGYMESYIQVNPVVYKRFLEAGGTVETLLGAAVSDRQVQYQVLLDQKDKYEKAWVRHERLLNTTNGLKRANNAVKALWEAGCQVIDEMDESERLCEPEVYKRRLRVEIDKLTGHWWEYLYMTIRKVICQAIYPHTDAEAILMAIDNAAEMNPGIDIREAGLLAVIEIVSEWVAKLIKVDHQ